MKVLHIDDLPHYTYADYKLWEGKWELIEGIAYAMAPAPHIRHQRISNKIAWLLDEKLANCKHCTVLLPIDWKVSDDTVVQPDNLVICHEPDNDNYITRAPEIIFEILSKSTAHKDRNTKFKIYEAEGVNLYIVVDGDNNCAQVFQLKQGKYAKRAEVTSDTVHFEISSCEFDFEFAKIWE